MTTFQPQPPVYGTMPVKNTHATAALVLGIIAIAGAPIPFLNVMSVVLGVLALVFGIIGVVKSRTLLVGKGKSIVAIVLAVVTFIVVPLVNSATANVLDDTATNMETLTQEYGESVEPTETEVAPEPETTPEETEAPAEPEMTMEEEQAIFAALDYLDYSAFSKQGLIDQLSSEYGEQFPVKVAEQAVASLDVDWNAEAVEAAQDYVDYSSFSCESLVDQLSSEYGDQFTTKQARHGATEIGLC